MLKFNEDLLQFIWRYKLLKPVPLITRSGNEITILKPGEINLDAGPDFFNAQIRLNGLTLAGNIEIHLQTSDWLKHNHQNDKAYDNIILHAVYEHDVELIQNTANNVEVLELKSLIDEKTLEVYEQLVGAKTKLPCASQLRTVNDLKLRSWMERMTIERLEQKVKRLEQLNALYNGDYTQTFYTALFRNFGFKVNALPFELLAKQLPLQLVLKHSDNLLHLEAILLGMSGLLEEQFQDKYIQNLQNEFEYFKIKYQLTPLKRELFKFSRLRPANFPNVRLAQLALLLHSKPGLFTNPQNSTSYNELMALLKAEPQGYWKEHYKIDGKKIAKEIRLGDASAENIIINTFAPFFFFYSKRLAKPEFTDYAITLLISCRLELNAKTKLFDAKKDKLNTSADSQAIINLYDNYCASRKCLNCGIAAAVLSR
jgi:Protein of unknown function (DUF2851)